MSGERKQRGSVVSDKEFLATRERIRRAGGSVEDVAKEVGMATSSVRQRVSRINRVLREAGQPELTRFPSGGGSRTSSDGDELAALLSQVTQELNATVVTDVDAEANVDDETVDETVDAEAKTDEMVDDQEDEDSE